MKNIEKKLWSALGVMFLFFTLLWACSCSPQNELFNHFPLDGQVTFSSPAYVWLRVGSDTIKMENRAEKMYLVNEIIPIKNEFRTIHCLD